MNLKFLIPVVLSCFFITGCNVSGEDTPQEYQYYAVFHDNYPTQHYEIGNNEMLRAVNPIVTTIENKQLVTIHFTLEEAKPTDSSKHLIKLLSTPKVVPLSQIKNSRLDTMGKGFIAELRPSIIGNYMIVDYKCARPGNKYAFNLVCDSAKLGNTNFPYIARDTMFLEMRYNDYGNSLGYETAIGRSSYNLNFAAYRQDSIVIAVKFKTSNENKTSYTKYKGRY